MAKTRPIGLLAIALIALPAIAAERATVDLIPPTRSGWTIGRLFAPITGLFRGGPGYWYDERTLEIDTQPSGASLDLFYLRENVQLRFERAESPVLLLLPKRIDAGSRDSVAIRVVLDGFLHEEVSVEVRSLETQATIDLSPLPNRLQAITHTRLSGRESLRFLTTEATVFRLRKMSDGFSIVLSRTRLSDRASDSMQSVSSAGIETLRAEQLGEDLVVWARLDASAEKGLDVRSTQGYDAIRDLHHLSVELVPAEGNAAALARCQQALDRIQRSKVFGCGLEFDRAMRSRLDPEALSRALTPSAAFLAPYLQSALRRLGELSPDGLIELTDTTKFLPSKPIDLAAASARSAEAVGYLSLLRELVAELEPTDRDRRNTLRGVIAPEMSREQFDGISDFAEDLERRCSARTSVSGP